MSPPVEVKAAVSLAALTVIALAVVLLVLTAPVSVKLPVLVAISTVPAALIAPRFMALLSIRLTLLPETTLTAPVKLLLLLSSVMLLPLPAVMPVVPVTASAADWVMAPLLVSVRLSLAVTAPLNAMVEFVSSVVLSLKVVAPPTVMAPAVMLPMVMPEKPSAKLVLKFAAVSARAPAPPAMPIVVVLVFGATASVPVDWMLAVPVRLSLSVTRLMALEDDASVPLPMDDAVPKMPYEVAPEPAVPVSEIGPLADKTDPITRMPSLLAEPLWPPTPVMLMAPLSV